MSDKILESRYHPAKYRYQHFIVEPQEKLKMVKQESQTDTITRIPNERALLAMVTGLKDLYDRDYPKGIHHKGTFIVADLTGLHKINDDFGREAGGNDYLRSVANSLVENSRPEDRYFRMGTSADEFVLHLHEVSSKPDLDKIMDRIDGRLRAHEIEFQGKYPGIKFGLSYSVATYGRGFPPDEALKEASNKLGQAKESMNGERVGNVGRLFVNENKNV